MAHAGPVIDNRIYKPKQVFHLYRGVRGMRLLSMFSVAAMAFGVVAPFRSARAAGRNSMDQLLDAIARVESRHDANAVGDSGRAIGAYQIHRRYWQDGTRILGVDWDYKEATDPVKARKIVRAYIEHYGRGRSLIDMARIHNGGPRGYRKKATRPYARKIAVLLNNATQSS